MGEGRERRKTKWVLVGRDVIKWVRVGRDEIKWVMVGKMI